MEAVVGKLSGPPRKREGGCFYPLPLDSATLAQQARERRLNEALARPGMKSDWPAMEDIAGVTINVEVGVIAGERVMEMAFATAGSWVGNTRS